MMKMAAILLLGVAAVVGYFMPTVIPPGFDFFPQVQFLDAAISVFLLVFVWGAFHLAEPARHGKRWSIIRDTAIPVVWLLLILALSLFFLYLSRDLLMIREWKMTL
jgi:hypothetical protein